MIAIGSFFLQHYLCGRYMTTHRYISLPIAGITSVQKPHVISSGFQNYFQLPMPHIEFRHRQILS
jgi:hypothetical protein